MERYLYRELSTLVRLERDDTFNLNYADFADQLVKEYMPSGSEFDNGTKLVWEKSSPSRLVFSFKFHHVHNNGCSFGWTEHECIIVPSFENGFNLRITGPNKNYVKSGLAEQFYFCLWKVLDFHTRNVRL